jgi:hypothetical protein
MSVATTHGFPEETPLSASAAANAIDSVVACIRVDASICVPKIEAIENKPKISISTETARMVPAPRS